MTTKDRILEKLNESKDMANMTLADIVKQKLKPKVEITGSGLGTGTFDLVFKKGKMGVLQVFIKAHGQTQKLSGGESPKKTLGEVVKSLDDTYSRASIKLK